MFDLRNQEDDLSEIFSGDFQAESDSCSTSGNVCCKEDQITDIVSIECEIFATNGFQCVEKSKCLSKERGNDEGKY